MLQFDRSLPDAPAVYLIKNIVTGDTYMGQTNHLAKRFREHEIALDKSAHWNPRLQAAYDQYGETAFAASVLEYVDTTSIEHLKAARGNSYFHRRRDLLHERERHFIQVIKPTYNRPSATGERVSIYLTYEAKQRLDELATFMFPGRQRADGIVVEAALAALEREIGERRTGAPRIPFGTEAYDPRGEEQRVRQRTEIEQRDPQGPRGHQ